jgi:type IV secretory pathway VirB2 component (pilin)
MNTASRKFQLIDEFWSGVFVERKLESNENQRTETSLKLPAIASPQTGLLSLLVFTQMAVLDAPSAARLSAVAFHLARLAQLATDARGARGPLAFARGAILRAATGTGAFAAAPVVLVIVVGRGLLRGLGERPGLRAPVCLVAAEDGIH